MRRLCGIAEISPKHYYSLLKGPEKHSLSYRHMAVLVSRETGKKVNRKRVLRVMREEGLLSSVRRRRYSEEVYAERQKLKGILT